MYGIAITDSADVGNTVDYASFELSQKSAPTNQTNPDLTKLRFVVDISGLKDDSSGTLSGTNNKVLDSAADVARYVIAEGNNNLDTSSFSADGTLETNYPRNIDGATVGRQNSSSILAEVCANSACRLVARLNGNIAIWPYGVEQTSVTTITEAHARLLKYEFLGTQSVINSVQLQYNKKVIALEIEDVQEGAARNFAASLDWENGESNEVDTWTAESSNLYGTRKLRDVFTTLKWIAEQDSAEFLAKYYLTTRAKPV